jgi:hypothetical protein
MFQNFNEKSLLGLPVYRGIPPPPPPPPNPHQSLPPHLGPPPGLFQYSAQPTQVFESNNKYDDIMMIDNEIKRMNIVCEDLTNQKYDIDRKILDVTRRIDVLLSKRESIKRSIPIERNLFQMSHVGGGGGQIYSAPNQKKIVKPLVIDPIIPTEGFIRSVTKILMEHDKLMANQIQSKLPAEDKPPTQSGIFQKLLLKIPGIKVKEEKVIRSNGNEEYDRIFYFDKVVEPIIPASNYGRNWKKECFKKMRGKPCKLNDKGVCNYCQ